jgi:MoaA/NifB/PqqE/SkfB family radical SAM enzyme
MEIIDAETLAPCLGYLHTQVSKKVFGFAPVLRYGPSRAYLEVSRTCNLQCPMCCRQARPMGSGYMNVDTCKSIVDGIKGTIGIGLSGWGEPLLNPEIIQILKYISDKGLLIAFNTNGLLLEKLADDLINIKHLYSISLSLDSLSETGKAHDSPAVLSGLQRLATLKKERHKKYPTLKVTLTAMNYNVNNIPNVVRETSKFGKLWVDTHEAIVMAKRNVEGPYAPPPQSELYSSVVEAAKEGQMLGVKVTLNRKKVPSTWQSKVYSKKPQTQKPMTPCSVPWDSGFIDFKGNVFPCCFNIDRKIGNAAEKPFRSIWRGDSYTKFRQDLLNDSDPSCRNCREGALWKNHILSNQ